MDHGLDITTFVMILISRETTHEMTPLLLELVKELFG